MIKLLKRILGIAAATNYTLLLKNGAQIIDVRTKEEFCCGHIKGSLNIPLDSLQQQIGKIKKCNPVITCCASGMRSASAKQVLQSHGFTQVYNGGGWTGLQNKIH